MSREDDDFDPYAALGVSPDATDAEISRAYKKSALKWHPDKQKGGSVELEAASKKFRDVREARAFLLDADREGERLAFRAAYESRRARREADERREMAMSSRRKEMRDDLRRKEEAAARDRPKASKKRDVDDLRRRGREMRETHAERAAMKELKQRRKDLRNAKDRLEERRVRLKWDRKKDHGLGENGGSPSEHSIASFLSKFGAVGQVEMLGAKGNVALVTFQDPSSCEACVKEYEDSNVMRAKYVGKRRDLEEAKEFEADRPNLHRRAGGSQTDRTARRAAEREALLRQMEKEDMGGPRRPPPPSSSSSQFPVPLPRGGDYEGLSPFEILELAEASVFGDGAESKE